MTDPDSTLPGLASAEDAGAVEPVPAGSDAEARAVWRSLRDTWLANAVLEHRGASIGGGYRWSNAEFVPVATRGPEGKPRVLFAKG